MGFQADHARDVFHSEKLHGLPKELMIRLLKTATFQSDLRMTEEQIFEKCTSWAKYQAEMKHIEESRAESESRSGNNSRRGSRSSTPSRDIGGGIGGVGGGDDVKMQDPDEWKRIIQPLLPSIRFPTMKGEYFASKVVNTRILSSDDCSLIMQYIFTQKPHSELKYGTQQRYFEFAFDRYYDATEVIKKVAIKTTAFRKRLYGY